MEVDTVKKSKVIATLCVVSKTDAEAQSTETVPDDDLEVRHGGKKTYRAPEGRPCWAQATELLLPVIGPSDGVVGIAEDPAIRHSESAACSAAQTYVAEIITDPPIPLTDLAEYVTVHRDGINADTGVPHVSSSINMSRHSTNEDIVAVPHSDEQIEKFQSAVPVPQILAHTLPAYVEHSVKTPRPYHEPIEAVNEDRLNEDPSTTTYGYKYRSATSAQPACKTRAVPSKHHQKTKSSLCPTNSGSSRDNSCDPNRRTGENRVGSTRRVSVKDSDMNRNKWPRSKSNPDKGASDRNSTAANRKFCGTANLRERNLVTSSVTAVVTPRPRSAHSVRSSASLGTQQVMTSSKPETEIQRRVVAVHSRVGWLITTISY